MEKGLAHRNYSIYISYYCYFRVVPNIDFAETHKTNNVHRLYTSCWSLFCRAVFPRHHDKYHIGMLISKTDVIVEITLNLFYFKIKNNEKTSALNFSSRLITTCVAVDYDTVVLTILLLGSKGEGEKYMVKQRPQFWIRLLN